MTKGHLRLNPGDTTSVDDPSTTEASDLSPGDTSSITKLLHVIVLSNRTLVLETLVRQLTNTLQFETNFILP